MQLVSAALLQAGSLLRVLFHSLVVVRSRCCDTQRLLRCLNKDTGKRRHKEDERESDTDTRKWERREMTTSIFPSTFSPNFSSSDLFMSASAYSFASLIPKFFFCHTETGLCLVAVSVVRKGDNQMNRQQQQHRKRNVAELIRK